MLAVGSGQAAGTLYRSACKFVDTRIVFCTRTAMKCTIRLCAELVNFVTLNFYRLIDGMAIISITIINYM